MVRSVMLNNREIATLIWIAIFLVFALSKADVRQAIGNLVHAALAWPILLSLAAMSLYIVLCVRFLAVINLWQSNNIKTTIVWAITFALVTMLDINRITEDATFFRKTIRDTVSATAIVVFIAEVYTFSLPIELLLVPLLAAAAGVHAYAQTRPEFAKAEKVVGIALSVIGSGILVYGAYQIIQNFREFATFMTAREFLIPIILSLSFLPFIYVLSIYISYERVFNSLRVAIRNQRIRSYAKIRAALAFRTDLDLLRRWKRNIFLFKPADKMDVRRSIYEIKNLKEREKRPPVIYPAEGWSPYAAKEFLRNEDLLTGDYHRLPDGWFASAPPLSIGTGIVPDNIAYYIDGDELAAKRLKLTLNVNSSDQPQASELRFFSIVRTLLKRALGDDLANFVNGEMSLKINANVTVGYWNISMARDDWPGSSYRGYSLKFAIQIAA